MGAQQVGHTGLPLGSAAMLGSPPGQQLLQGNGSAHGGSYRGGSYHGGSAHGSYHGGSYHGGSAHGGSYHGGGYGGSYSGAHSLASAGDGSYHGGQAGTAGTAYGGLASSLSSFGSAGIGINANLLAQAQAAALQQQLSSSTGLGGSLDGSSPSQLISLLSASTGAAAAGSAGMGAPRYAGQPAGSPQGEFASLLGAQHEPAVHGGWLRSTLPPATSGGLTGSGGSGSIGPASARAGEHAGTCAGTACCLLGVGLSKRPYSAGCCLVPASPFKSTSPHVPPAPVPAPPLLAAGPRIFVGKLNKDTSEQDVKEHFMRFGFVLDVYLPRGAWVGR